MAPQVGDSQVLEWTGRLMPWKGEVSSLFSAQLNIVSKDALPTSPILGHARKGHFQLPVFQVAPAPFHMEETGGPHCKEILNTDGNLKKPIAGPCLNACLLKCPCGKDLYPKDGLRNSLRIGSGAIQLTGAELKPGLCSRCFYLMCISIACMCVRTMYARGVQRKVLELELPKVGSLRVGAGKQTASSARITSALSH